MPVSRPHFFSFGILLAGVLTFMAPAPGQSAETQPGPISKAAALKSLDAHASAWEQKIRSQSPRLYFSAQEWPDVLKEIETLPASRSNLKTKFFEAMDRVVTEPIPAYLPPEQMVGKPTGSSTLFAAMEELWQRDVGNNIFALALAARIKPDAPYRAKMHDLVMAAVHYDTWGRSNSERMGSNADLAIGHVGRGIAVAYDWHRDAFSETELQTIRQAVSERLPCLLKALYGDAYWSTGFEENHNQVSVAALAHCGLAFYDEIPGAPEWLAAARLNFQEVGRHIPADGSSVEGVSYWSYGISYILQYIEATRPIIDSADLYELPYFKNAAAYRLMAATPGLVGNLPWGDSVPRGWSTPHYIIYRLAAQYEDRVASWFADHLPTPRGTTDEFALNLLWSRNAPASGDAPTALDARLTVNDLVTTRSGWESSDYVLSLKGGYTNRNHSHLDAGALGLAFGDDWVLIAPGYGRGAGEGAFWDSGGPRWTFFSNASESHSTLIVNGKNQRFDRNARATVTRFFSSPEWNWTTLDLTRAYLDVQSITRSALHRRGDYILVLDSISAEQPVTVEWLAQFRNKPETEASGSVLTEGKNGRLRVTMLTPAAALAPRLPTVPKVDVKLATHHTYSLGQSGENTAFVALLQPMAGTVAAPALKAEFINSESADRLLKISDDEWTDYLQWSEKPAALRLAFSDDQPPILINGSLASVRITSRGIDSLLALETTSVELPGFAFRSEIPCDLSLQKTTDGGWAVTASRDIQPEISLPAGTPLHLVANPPPSQK